MLKEKEDFVTASWAMGATCELDAFTVCDLSLISANYQQSLSF